MDSSVTTKKFYLRNRCVCLWVCVWRCVWGKKVETERWDESWGVTVRRGDFRVNFECISYIFIWPQGESRLAFYFIVNHGSLGWLALFTALLWWCVCVCACMNRCTHVHRWCMCWYMCVSLNIDAWCIYLYSALSENSNPVPYKSDVNLWEHMFCSSLRLLIVGCRILLFCHCSAISPSWCRTYSLVTGKDVQVSNNNGSRGQVEWNVSPRRPGNHPV